ncbi:hypothetical protein [Bradyrhizobium sp. 2TAF24]|uniref:hypothetical protein n=1 Tax=Bradyrhizobium sp. 2TAF24 TaxID=3233011 RepID=UPI003F8DD77C
MGHHIVFQCPDTGLKVQHWLDKPPDDARPASYVSVACAACTNIHFINSENGRLLGDDRK